MNVFVLDDFHTFGIHNLALFVHNVIVFENVFSYTEVSALYRALSVFYTAGQHFGLKRLILVDFEHFVNPGHSFAAETLCEIVFERNEKHGRTGIALTTASTTQLIVDTPGFVTFCTENVKTARGDDFFFFFVRLSFEFFVNIVVVFANFFYVVRYFGYKRSGEVYNFFLNALFAKFSLCHKLGITAEQNIRSAPCHVGCDGNRAVSARLRDDVRFARVAFSVKNVMLNAFSDKQFAYFFRFFYGNGTDEHRLTFFVSLGNLFHNRLVFAVDGFVDYIRVIFSRDGFVGGYFQNVKTVNSAEFLFLRFCGTGHTGKFFIKPEVVLEGNGRVSFVFVTDFNAFFRFYRLMQTVGISSADHQTTGKFVYYYDLAVRNDVIVIALKDIIRFQRLLNMVRQSRVFYIGKTCKTEETFRFFCAGFGYLHGFFFYVYGKVFVENEGFYEFVCGNVFIAGFLPSAGNDKRGSRLVDKDRVHFVHDGEIERTLNHLLESAFKVIAEVIEAHFVVGTVSYVACVSLLFVLVFHTGNRDAYGKPHKFVNLSHPLRVTGSEVIVYGNDVNAFPGKRVKVRGKGCDEGFAFAGFHFRDAPLVQAYTADYLDFIVLHSEYAERRFSYGGKRVYQNIVQCFALSEPVL